MTPVPLQARLASRRCGRRCSTRDSGWTRPPLRRCSRAGTQTGVRWGWGPALTPQPLSNPTSPVGLDGDRAARAAGRPDRQETLNGAAACSHMHADCLSNFPRRSGTLCMAEYVAMSVFLQSASATFRAFDGQGQGRITLDFSQVRPAA